MTDMNFMGVVGRLVADLEIKYTNSGLAIGSSSIAVNRSVKQKDGSYKDEASFFTFKIIGKTAEGLKPYLLKGKQVAIEGYLKQDRWVEQDGTKRSSVYIGVNNIELLGGKSENMQGNTQQNQQNYAPAQQQYNQNYQPSQMDGFGEDYPFPF